MKDTVLLLTNQADDSTDSVIANLEKLGQRFYRFNTESFPLETKIVLTTTRRSIEFESSEERVDLNNVKSVWYRRPAPPMLAETNLSPGYVRFIKNESEAALWSLYTTIDVFWMNPPLYSVNLLQRNKLYQMKDAASAGLKIPDTVITNDPSELLKFCDRFGGSIAVKLLRGDWFVKEESNIPLFVFTQKVTRDQIAKHRDDVRLSPILAQEYIDKDFELRITIVGEKIFACAIRSQEIEQTRIDWRNNNLESIKHELYELPSDIKTRIFTLMRKWHLSYGAIDMIVTPRGDYVFLEINPGGQWLWIEEMTGIPISQALAELLANPPRDSCS
jgi:glutathione synthase/RimK-type ligase-like ATP-grasp enzyme